MIFSDSETESLMNTFYSLQMVQNLSLSRFEYSVVRTTGVLSDWQNGVVDV